MGLLDDIVSSIEGAVEGALDGIIDAIHAGEKVAGTVIYEIGTPGRYIVDGVADVVGDLIGV